MASAQKKVVVRRFDLTLAWGYLAQSGFTLQGKLELMEPDGRRKPLAINDIKMISYVRYFNLDDTIDPERIGRKVFLGRPKGEGLWLRVTFCDGDQMEGLASFGTGFLDAAAEDNGIFLAPPELRSNTLRVFVPRQAIASLELLGAVLSPSARVTQKKSVENAQTDLLFNE